MDVSDINASTWSYVRKHDIMYIVITIAAAAAALYYFPGAIQFILVAVLIIFIGGYNRIRTRFQDLFFQEFAQSVGFSYQEEISPADISGRIASSGHDPKMHQIMSGTYQGIPTRIFNLDRTFSSGRSSQVVSVTVFEATFTSAMPDIACVPKYETIGIGELGAEERLQLESTEFNQHFFVYTPKGFEIEAYQIFTPDVMSVLLDKARGLSFEFFKNSMYIYMTDVITTKERMQNMFTLADYLIELFQKTSAGIHVPAPATDSVQ